MDKIFKRKKQEVDTNEEEEDDLEEGVDLPLLPKRTKVQAQRKFAQGSSPMVTPVKETPPEVETTPVIPMAPKIISTPPVNQPKTEDFLTFLCFRGTPLISGHLSAMFSNPSPSSLMAAPTSDQKNATGKKGKKKQLTEEELKGKKKISKQKTPAAQLKKLKQQDQTRMRGDRPSENTETKVPASKKQLSNKFKTKDVKKASSIGTVGRVQGKPSASLRKVHMTQRERLKSRHALVKKPLSNRSGLRSSGVLAVPASEDGPPSRRPETKRPKPDGPRRGHTAIAGKRGFQRKERLVAAETRGRKKRVPVREKEEVVPPSKTSVIPSVRPSRKSKEAAAVYMDLLGNQVKNPGTYNEDDNSSVESFPELPKARAMERREKQIKDMAAAQKRKNETKSQQNFPVHIKKPCTMAKTVASKIASKKLTVQSLLKKRMTRSSIIQPKLRKQIGKGKDETLDKRKTRANVKCDQTTDKTKESKEEDKEENGETVEKTKETRPSRNVKSVQNKPSERTESPKTRKTRSDFSPLVAIDKLTPDKTVKPSSKKDDEDLDAKCETNKKPKENARKKVETNENKTVENIENKCVENKKSKSNTKEETKNSSVDQDQNKADDKIKTRASRSVSKATDEASKDGSQRSIEENEADIKSNKKERSTSKTNEEKAKVEVKRNKTEEGNNVERKDTNSKNLEAKSKVEIEEKAELNKKVAKKCKAGIKPKINFDEIVRDETFVSKNRAAKISNDERKAKPESSGKAKKKKDTTSSNDESSATVFVTKVVVEKVVDTGSPVKPDTNIRKLNVTESTEKSQAVKSLTFDETPHTAVKNLTQEKTVTNDVPKTTCSTLVELTSNEPCTTPTISSSPCNIPKDDKALDKTSPVPKIVSSKTSTQTDANMIDTVVEKIKETVTVTEPLIVPKVPVMTTPPRKINGNKTEPEKDNAARTKVDSGDSEMNKNTSVTVNKTDSPVKVHDGKITNEEKCDVRRDGDTRKSSTPVKVKRIQMTPSKMILNNSNVISKKVNSPEDKSSNIKDSIVSYSSSILNINAHSTLKPRSRATAFVKGDTSQSNPKPMMQIPDSFRLNFSKDFDLSKKDLKSPSHSLLNKKDTSISESELDKELSNFVKDIVKTDWEGKSFDIPLNTKPPGREGGTKSRKLISTIDFVNSTPVKCSSSEEPVSIRNDKVIISPLRKLTENEIRILLAQESPMKVNEKSTEVFNSSALENLSRSKDPDDSVSKLCIEKITNEIISLLDPKMDVAETQDIIKKYNLNKQLHSRLTTNETSKFPAQTPGSQTTSSQNQKTDVNKTDNISPLPLHRLGPFPSQKTTPTVGQKCDTALIGKPGETLNKQSLIPNQKKLEKSPLTNQQTDKSPLTNQRLDTSLLINQPTDRSLLTNQPTDKSPMNQKLGKSISTNQQTDKSLFTNQRVDKSYPMNQIDKSLFTNQLLEKSLLTNQADKSLLTNQKSDKISLLTSQKSDKSLSTNQGYVSSDKQSILPNQRLDKQLNLSNQRSVTSDKQSVLTSPRSDKQDTFTNQKSVTPDKQSFLASQKSGTTDKQLLPKQRSDKLSLLAYQKPGTIDKQYRLTDDPVTSDKQLLSTNQWSDKPCLFTNQRLVTPGRQSASGNQSMGAQATNKKDSTLTFASQKSSPQQMISDSTTKPTQKFESPSSSSQVVQQKKHEYSPQEHSVGLNLSQKHNPGVKSIQTDKSSSCTSSTAPPASNTFNRPSQTFSEVPITLSNTYQTILDSRLHFKPQAANTSPLKSSNSTGSPKPEAKSINNVQKTDCDKTSLSQVRGKFIDEDNAMIANFVKEKNDTPQHTEKSSQSLDDKVSESGSNSKTQPERQIIKAFEDKYEPKSSPTKNIRKYSNLGKGKQKSPQGKQAGKQDRNFTKSLRTKKDTNYLEEFSSTDTSEDDLTSKASSKSTTKKRKTKVNSKEKAPLSDFSSDSDVEDLIEKIRKDEPTKSKQSTDDETPKSKEKSTKTGKSDTKKSKPDINLDESKVKTKVKAKTKEDNEDLGTGSRRLRNKQSVLYNLESLETDSDTTEDELVPIKNKSEPSKKRKSKKSSASENEESEDKVTKGTKNKKMKTEPEESSEQAKPKRGRKKKQKEVEEESELEKETTKKNDRVEDETKETSESDSDVRKKKTLKKRSKKQSNKQVEDSSDSETEDSKEKSVKKGTRKKGEDMKKEVLDTSLKTGECGTRKNLRRKQCHLYAENLSSNSEDDLELLIQNRSVEIETQNLMNHPRKSKKLLDQVLAKTKIEAKEKTKDTRRSSKEKDSATCSEDEDEGENKTKPSKNDKTTKNKLNEKSKEPNKKPSKSSRQSEASESESEKSSSKKPLKTPKKDTRSAKKTQSPRADDKSASPSRSADSSCNQKRSVRASRTQSLMIDTSTDDSEDDPLLAIAKTISRNEVRMSRRSIDLLHAKEKEIQKKNESSEEDDGEESDESESEDDTRNDKKSANKTPTKQAEDVSTKKKTKDATTSKVEIIKPIALSAKTSQCSSLDVSNKISSLIEKDKLKRGLQSSEKSKEESSVTSQQLQQEAHQRLGENDKRPFTPEKIPMSREQLHSSWKSAFQNLKLPKTSPSVSKKPMDRNAWIRKHAALSKPKLAEFSKNSNANFEPFKINYSRSSSPMSLSSQNSDNVGARVEGKHHNLPLPVEQTLKRMANISPKVNKSFQFERNQSEPKSSPVVETKLLTTGKIEDIPKAGNTNEQIMKWLNDSIPNDDSSCDDTNSTSKKLTPRYCQDDTDTSVASSVIDKGIVSAPVQLKDIFSSPSFASEKISSVKVDDYKRLKQNMSRSSEKKDVFTSPSLDRKRYGEETPEKKKHLESETDSFVSDLSSCDENKPEKKAIFQQRRSLAERLKDRQNQSSLAKIAFSPQNESSVYAFEAEPVDTSPSTPFRRSKNNTNTSPNSVSPSLSKPGSPCNSSIAVQVNFETETVLECSTTQTELSGSQADDGHLFYIPLQKTGKDASAIQGVAVKLGTEGPDQRVIMSAKLVTKPPPQSDFAKPSSVSCLVPQRRVRPFNTPIVGTVQPMSRPSSGTQVSPRSQHTQTPPPVPKPPAPSSTSSTVSNSSTSTSTTTKSGKKSKSKSSQSTVTTADKKRPSSPLPSTSTSPSRSPAPQAVKHKTFPSKGSRALMVEAPTYYPNEKEFQDPFEYIEKIRPSAEQFGICRIVPPSSFKPECKLNDDMRFTAYNQYVHKMLHRWGPNVKEMVAIRKYLATQSVSMQQLPLIGGIEVDLPRLYSTVQQCGGLSEVIEKKRWPRVADLMKIPRLAQDRLTKLDDIYCKYLLPYDTLSHDERSKLFDAVEAEWGTHFNSSLEDDEEEEEEEEGNDDDDLDECIVKGRSMPLSAFYRIARNTMAMYFKSDNPNDPGSNPSPAEVESEFWNHVTNRMLHICVHSASIDTGSNGCGFPTAKNSTFAKHPWNLKVLTNNSASILRSLNSLVGVTVPTLHVGMLFSACCWYRDPHGLPWIEYLHSGASKIWYGIPDEHSTAFRSTMMSLFPHYCRSDKTIWLSSDVAMIPPSLLTEKGVSLSRVVQEPGQFILVFPSAFTSSIATGYLVAESVYFARPSWLSTCERVFKDMQDSCEPSEFSLELLLFSIAADSRTNIDVLNRVLPMIESIRDMEVAYRSQLTDLGLRAKERMNSGGAGASKKGPGRKKAEEVDYCLRHAIETLSQNLDQLKHCKLMYYYDEAELEEVITKLKDKIKTKSLKKLSEKHSA
ncbi:hypothetical protein M8J76_004967 [Diaphorina citri]|nr:hypothetical protein M8J76_004967 [Diaphorina citri]